MRALLRAGAAFLVGLAILWATLAGNRTPEQFRRDASQEQIPVVSSLARAGSTSAAGRFLFELPLAWRRLLPPPQDAEMSPTSGHVTMPDNTAAVPDPRRFVVGVASLRQSNAEDLARSLARRLPAAWSGATGGRSELSALDAEAMRDVFVVLTDFRRDATTAVQMSFAGGRVRLVQVFVGSITDDDDLIAVVIHELGHALGCCFGPETAGGHWASCDPTVEVMCEHGRALKFSERELRQMRMVP